jgi:hypothetical protein
MQILDTAKIPPEKRHLMASLADVDFTHVAKKAAYEYNLDFEELKNIGSEELKKFYALRILDDQSPVAIPVNLDPMVHVHVLFTKEYGEFCDTFFGGMFHHFPCTPDDANHMRWLGDRYRETVTRYENTFGVRDTKWWPDPTEDNFTHICCGCSGGAGT